MESCEAIARGFHAKHFLSPSHSIKPITFLPSTLFTTTTNLQHSPSSLKLQNVFAVPHSSSPVNSSCVRRRSLIGAVSTVRCV
ncbi:hypothetical protein ACHQM5_003536 [Ranunculus cassubicifolius]